MLERQGGTRQKAEEMNFDAYKSCALPLLCNYCLLLSLLCSAPCRPVVLRTSPSVIPLPADRPSPPLRTVVRPHRPPATPTELSAFTLFLFLVPRCIKVGFPEPKGPSCRLHSLDLEVFLDARENKNR